MTREEAKLVRQQKRRQTKPAIHIRTRALFTSPEEYYQLYAQLFEEQQGRCAICQKPPVSTRRFHMDHDHETLKIRGLLCFSCNNKLGFVEKYLAQIVRYLK